MSRWTLTKLASPHGNCAVAGRNRFSWAEFERLPRLVRDVLNFAPVELGSGRAFDALRGGGSAEAVARAEIGMARRFLRQETLMIYGPGHPSLTEASRAA